MAFSTSALSTGKTSSGTISVNDWNVGLADNLHTGVMRCIGSAFTTGAGGVGTVDFSSISTAFQSLRFTGSIRAATSSATMMTLEMRFNNDSASTAYGGITLEVQDAGGITAAADNTRSAHYIGVVPTCATTSGQYGAFTVDIPNYLSTEHYKAAVWTNGYNPATSSQVYYSAGSGSYQSFTAVNRVTFYVDTGNISSSCRISMYGIPALSTG